MGVGGRKRVDNIGWSVGLDKSEWSWGKLDEDR